MPNTKTSPPSNVGTSLPMSTGVFATACRAISGLPPRSERVSKNSSQTKNVIAYASDAIIFQALPTEVAPVLIQTTTTFTPSFVIPRESECHTVYGDFQMAGWERENLIRCDLSEFQKEFQDVAWLIHRGWFGFRCHRLVAPIFQAGFRNIVARDLATELKTFDGCFNIRKKTSGVNEYSTHSWGIAIDLNAADNRGGQKDFSMTEDFAKCFEDAGLVWGGRWKTYPDAMHFQYAT